MRFLTLAERTEQLRLDDGHRTIASVEELTSLGGELGQLHPTVTGRRDAGDETSTLQRLDQLVHGLSRDV